MRAWRVGVAGVLLVGSACADAADPLFLPEPNDAIEVESGVFRLTTGGQPDLVRAVLADGRVLFVTQGMTGGPPAFGVASIDPSRGPAREEASVYQLGFPEERVTHLVHGGRRHLLVTLMPPRPQWHWCGSPDNPAIDIPGPPFVGWHLNVLPLEDGPAVSSLHRPAREFPVITNVGSRPDGEAISPKRIRFVPAMDEAEHKGTNPWGPTVTADERYAFVSDGEAIWRYDMAAPEAAPDSITTGSYPLLSPDETSLFVARPSITDSVEATIAIGDPLDLCYQTDVTYEFGEWTLVRRDLAGGMEQVLGTGAGAARLGDTALVVRRADGLYVVHLSDGSARLLVADSTATSPAVARNGSILAYTSRRFGNPDVLVRRLGSP